MTKFARRKGESLIEWQGRIEADGWQGAVGFMLGAIACLAIVLYALGKGWTP